MRESQSEFLFIMGCRRSGTTLLGTIFDSHGDMAVAHEARFIVSRARDRERYEIAAAFDVPSFVSDLSRESGFQRMGLDVGEVEEELSDRPVISYADAIAAIFAMYARRQGKVRYGDKMPGYVLHVKLLSSLFPKARFVHIIRDGRDVALSLGDYWFAGRSVGEAAMFWKRRVAAGRDAGRRLGGERYREVRYEDLVGDPETVVRGLATFAHLEFEPSMLHFFQRGDEVVDRTGNPGLHQRLLLPTTQGLRDWRREMGGKDLAVFEELAGGLLSELGYERRCSGSDGRTRFRAAKAQVRWHGRRLQARLAPADRD